MISEYIKKYGYYLSLLVIIYILLITVSYENDNKKIEIITIGEQNITLNNEMLIKNKLYISYNDAKQIWNDDVYIDKISRKLIITKSNSISKYELNSNIKYVNFEEQSTKDNVYIKENGSDYLLLQEVADNFNMQVVFNIEKNTLNLVTNEQQSGNILKNRVYGYFQKNKKYDRIVIESENIQVVKNTDYFDKTCKFYTVIVNQNGKNYLLYVLKSDVNIEKIEEEQIINKSQETFSTFVYNEDNQKITLNSTDGVILGGFKLINSNGDLENNIDDSILNKSQKTFNKVYVTLNNGYESSNYDSGNTIQMLQSDVAREKVVKNVIDTVVSKNIDGIVINFRQFNSSNNTEFIQFVKEFAAYARYNKKEIMVYVPYSVDYTMLQTLTEYSDKVILIQYGTKELSSKVSGSHSSITWIQNNLNDLENNNIELSKLIIEIPLYSILWTEKNNMVVQADTIRMKLLEQYISKNNMTITKDLQTGQNYVQHQKGSLVYKIWLEDEYSVKQKIEIAKSKKLAGISLYKMGYESENLFE